MKRERERERDGEREESEKIGESVYNNTTIGN